QASHSGEINVAVHQKKVRRRNIRAMIGEVILKKSKGRRAQNEITVFDSTGLAIQDTAVASLMYRLAIKEKIGKRINLID
ncbi:MAG: alanine dehydrogenase, partial [Lysobacterales bacterium]